jgi:hypothetical protein
MGEQAPGYYGPAPAGDPLPAEQVIELAEGTPVTIIWSGGNGPHDYVITVNKWGVRHAAQPGETNERMRFYNPLTTSGLGPVGTSNGHTRVWLRDAGDS